VARKRSSVRLGRPGKRPRPGSKGGKGAKAGKTKSAARLPRRTPGAGSSSAKLQRSSSSVRTSPAQSGSGITPAQRPISARAGGSVAGRRVQGIGLVFKMSLSIALLVAAVAAAWGSYQVVALSSNLKDAIKRNGAQAALILAEHGKKLVGEYDEFKKQPTGTTWQVRRLDAVLIFRERSTRRALNNDIEDAVILSDEILVASARQAPQNLQGQEEPIEGRLYDNVECLSGIYVRGGRRIPVYQFKTSFQVGQRVGTARVVLSRSKVEEDVNSLMASALIAGALFVLAGVAVSYFLAAGIVRPVRRLMRDMDIVSRGDFDHVTKRTSSDEIGLLAMAFNDMTKSLKMAQELEVQQEKVQAELETAREIQAHLLPAKIPQLPGFDIYQAYSPAKEVGGDYFDFIPVDRENLGVVVADVSGKGVPGSMVMGSTRTVLRMLAAGNTSASDTLSQTNSIVARDMKRGMFVTALYGVLNVRQKTFAVASAGHNPMVLFRARSGKCELINPAGIALGFDKGPIFNRTVKEQTLQLYKGDRLVLYTDGVVEAMNEKQEEFGDERFYRWVQTNARGRSRDFVRSLLAELEQHRGGAEQHDDITIVTVGVE
jgi:serine phosphatase RsbU (regulator of sigma subunit)